MKALMFGWEFPPHILGGLGTASYGLTRGMAQQPDMEITFVIPKPWGDEDQSFLRIIGANSVPVVWKENSYDYVKQRMEGRMSPEEYFHFRNVPFPKMNLPSGNRLSLLIIIAPEKHKFIFILLIPGMWAPLLIISDAASRHSCIYSAAPPCRRQAPCF